MAGLFMAWPGVMKTGLEIELTSSSQNCGFVSVDKLRWLSLSFFSSRLCHDFIACCWFTIVAQHWSDVMVLPEPVPSTGERLETDSWRTAVAAASSPSSLRYRPPDIGSKRHLSGKHLTPLMFRDIRSPSRSAYQRILILPDEFKLQIKYLFKAHLVSLSVLGFTRMDFFFLIVVISWKQKSLILSLLKVFAESLTPCVSL